MAARVGKSERLTLSLKNSREQEPMVIFEGDEEEAEVIMDSKLMLSMPDLGNLHAPALESVVKLDPLPG